MKTCTEVAAHWLTSMDADVIPIDVRDTTKLRLLDVLGLVLAASTTEFGAAMRAGVASMGSAGPSRTLPYGERTTPGLAALANGAHSQALQYDDTHNETIIHVSSPNTAAVLALAEAQEISGREALCAIALGIELTCRFGLIAPGRFHKNGFHPSGIFGTFGATCAAARLLRLSPPETVSALGLAGSLASGILECWTDGTDTQWVHPGWSAQAGITAAQLARAGVTGPATVLEGRLGLFASHVQDRTIPLDFERASRALGEVWASRNSSFKPYPCAHVIHSFLDALFDLQREHGLASDEVEEIICPIAAYMVDVVCEPREEKEVPPNSVRARVSLQWSLAEALSAGRLAADAYGPDALSDPAILDLARRVTYVVDETAPGTERYKGWVIVRTEDGRRLEKIREHNHGSLADPMTPEEIRAKFADNASRALPAGRIEQIVEAVDRLDRAESVAPLLDLCMAERDRDGMR